MNIIQGIRNEVEEGIEIRYNPLKSGTIVMGTSEQNDVRVRTHSQTTTVSGQELIIDMKHVTIQQFEKEPSFFPSYLSVTDKGRLVVRNDGYWLMGALCVLILKMAW